MMKFIHRFVISYFQSFIKLTYVDVNYVKNYGDPSKLLYKKLGMVL